MICSNCSKTIADDSIFCPNCGNKIAAPTAEAAKAKQETVAAVKDAADIANAVPPDLNETVQMAKQAAERAIPQIQRELASRNDYMGMNNIRPQESYVPPAYTMQPPQPSDDRKPAKVKKPKKEKVKTYFGGGALAFCLILIMLLSGSTAWFAFQYFSAIGAI